MVSAARGGVVVVLLGGGLPVDVGVVGVRLVLWLVVVVRVVVRVVVVRMMRALALMVGTVTTHGMVVALVVPADEERRGIGG